MPLCQAQADQSILILEDAHVCSPGVAQEAPSQQSFGNFGLDIPVTPQQPFSLISATPEQRLPQTPQSFGPFDQDIPTTPVAYHFSGTATPTALHSCDGRAGAATPPAFDGSVQPLSPAHPSGVETSAGQLERDLAETIEQLLAEDVEMATVFADAPSSVQGVGSGSAAADPRLDVDADTLVSPIDTKPNERGKRAKPNVSDVLVRITEHCKHEHFKRHSNAKQYISVAISALETELPFVSFNCKLRPKMKVTDRFAEVLQNSGLPLGRILRIDQIPRVTSHGWQWTGKYKQQKRAACTSRIHNHATN